MENKKLLKYLLKDLSELEELLVDREEFIFDEVEIEFIQTRVKGARKLVQMYLDYPIEPDRESPRVDPPKPVQVEIVTPVVEKPAETPQPEKIRFFIGGNSNQAELKKDLTREIDEKPQPGKKSEPKPIEVSPRKMPGVVNEIVEFIEETIAEIDIEEKLKVNEPVHEIGDIKSESDIDEKPEAENAKSADKKKAIPIQQELKLDDDAPEMQGGTRLADKFSKERSVNDLVADDFNKLEHKLSNMPLASIQASIGINDRFQYVRELFNGDSDLYNKTVSQLDSMNDLKEAVAYLQGNFKWKKNEISLKFVNLLKRRFPQ